MKTVERRGGSLLVEAQYRRGWCEEYEVEVDRVYHCDSWKGSWAPAGAFHPCVGRWQIGGPSGDAGRSHPSSSGL